MTVTAEGSAIVWIGDIPRIFAGRCPDKIAIACGQSLLTYTGLKRQSDLLAAHFRRSKLERGTRIAYIGRNSELYFVALFACIDAGLVLVPINWRLSATETAFVLNDCRPALVLCDPEFAGQAGGAKEDGPQVLLTDVGTRSARDLRQILNDDQSKLEEEPPVNADAFCLLMYTSGTSGAPKGVMISHRQLSLGRQSEFESPEWSDFTADDLILSPMPNFHAGGTTWMLMGLSRGCTCVLTSDPSPANIVALAREWKATRVWMPPTIIRRVVEEIEKGPEKLPCLRVIHYGGEPMSPSLLERAMRALGTGFGQFYGMTETGGAVVTYLSPADHDPDRSDRLRSVGKPMPGMEIRICDDQGHAVPTGRPGEIWIRSECLSCGYWNRPGIDQGIVRGGWYRSGDGGYLDDDGYLILTDRIKDMIISGGENIFPGEVEAVLARHPSIGQVAVVGVADAQWGERAVACLRLAANTDLDEQELVDFARGALAGFKIPREFVVMDALPVTASGKLNRAALRERLLRRS